MTTLAVNDVELFYERAGGGELIVFTHGAWTDGRTWQAVTDGLVDRFEVAAWDRRGHSRSLDGTGPGSVEADLADLADLAGLIEALATDPVHVVGGAIQCFVDQIALGPGAWEQLPEELKTVMEANASTVADDLRDGSGADSVDVDALAESPVPLLISTGSEGPELERGAAHELARRLPAARLTVLPDAGHTPHRTHTDSYVAMLTNFVEGASMVRSVS